MSHGKHYKRPDIIESRWADITMVISDVIFTLSLSKVKGGKRRDVFFQISKSLAKLITLAGQGVWAPCGPLGPFHAPVAGPLYRHRLHPQLLIKLSDGQFHLSAHGYWFITGLQGDQIAGNKVLPCVQPQALRQSRAGSRGKRILYIS